MTTSFPRALAQPVSIASLIERLGGRLAPGAAASIEVRSVAAPHTARPGSLVFLRGANAEQVAEAARRTEATAIVAAHEIAVSADRAQIVTEDPLAWYIRALHLLFPEPSGAFTHPSAVLSPTATVGEGVAIGPGSVIEDACRIGDRCRIGSNCYIGPGTILGDGTFVQDNAAIGGVGLGYHTAPDGERLFFPHLGAAVLGRQVVVGAGSVIVRGELDDTTLGDRVRIGNLVNIGHNVRIGADTVISSGTCVAGGASIGQGCNIAVGVSINAKRKVGDGAQIGLGSVVVRDIAAGASVFGVPAAPLRTMRRF
jgi:UDP-3-O-[3-hydroxymyristoyl] glucosamine N-acyltransferase